MALINCPECQTEVSDQAEKCIKCGFPISIKKSSPVQQPKVIVQKKEEGLFLQTLNAGCMIFFVILAAIILLAIILH